MPTEEILKHATWLENVALRCIYSEHYFVRTTGHEGKFWPIVQNALGESVCVLWAHVFGNRSDDLHYTKFFSHHEIKEIGANYLPEKIKARLLDRINMDDVEYQQFWTEVKNCRDQFVAHKEISTEGLIFPHVNICREMMEEIRTILKEIFTHWKETQPNEDIEYWVDYYAWNPNDSLEKECEKAFSNDINLMAKNWLTRT